MSKSEKTERCPTCDRAECEQFMCVRDFPQRGPERGENIRDCESHRVDWRARALAAESSQRGRGEVDEEFVARLASVLEQAHWAWLNEPGDATIESEMRRLAEVVAKFLADLGATARPAPSEAPRPLTVADALRDERVRRGEMAIRYETSGGTWEHHIRIGRDGRGDLATEERIRRHDDPWCRWYPIRFELTDLDRACTLVPASAAPSTYTDRARKWLRGIGYPDPWAPTPTEGGE